MATRKCFREPPPDVDPGTLTGALIVIEGPDGSGRSTHIELLARWLEETGYPVARTGLTRSELVAQQLDRAKLGNVLSPRTMSLFYATDFYDQLENVIVPAMRAGSVVLADRYIFTLMARDLVRGAEQEWLENLYSMAIVPDAVFYFSVSLETLTERTLTAYSRLDYWESGMDLGLSRDWFTSFEQYQEQMREQFRHLQERYDFDVVDANGGLEEIQLRLRDDLQRVLDDSYRAPEDPPLPDIPEQGPPPMMNLEVF